MQGLGISALATRTIHARHVLVGWLGYDIVLRGSATTGSNPQV